MKKIMSMMLGMSLLIGAASFAFADDTSTAKKDTTKKKGKKGSKTSKTS